MQAAERWHRPMRRLRRLKLTYHAIRHFSKIKSWSKSRSEDAIAWDGNLVCCIVYNCDGIEISPTSGTALYHTFAVHRELFLGLDY